MVAGSQLWDGLATIALIEAAGNQAYIFGTNRMRENVGASQLTHSLGAWAREAARDLGGRVEIVNDTAGKVVAVCADASDAEALVFGVTRRALVDAPGLDAAGVTVACDLSVENVADGIARAFVELGVVRADLRGKAARQVQLPIVAGCRVSSGPAADLVVDGRKESGEPNEPQERSLASLAKRKAAKAGYDRMGGRLGLGSYGDFDRLADNGWRAVVHADGNGLGQIFSKFGEHVEGRGLLKGDVAEKNRQTLDLLREFSAGLEKATIAAFESAVCAVGLNRRNGLAPLIIGGDDVTLVCPGEAAVDLTIAYLKAFTENTAALAGDGQVLQHPATASAAIVITKAHFPFFAAYDFVEERLSEVKRSSTPSQALLDATVVFDTNTRALARSGPRWWGGPYEVLSVAPESVTEFVSVDELTRQVTALRDRKTTGERKLPRSQIAPLRQLLREGQFEAADSRLSELRDRDTVWDGLVLADGSLRNDQGACVLVDALDLAVVLDDTDPATSSAPTPDGPEEGSLEAAS